MCFSKLHINLLLLAIALVAVIVDKSIVSDTENVVRIACDTRVAYDKSGSLYCLDIADKSIVWAGK
jgi:hypothetical protein